jgi:hypothetical protein
VFDTQLFDLKALLPTETEAVVVGKTSLVKVEFEAGGTLREGWRHSFAEPVDFAIREGDTVLTTRTREGQTTVCPFAVAARTAGPCRTFPGQPLGAGSGGLWLLELPESGSGEQVRHLDPSLQREASALTSVYANWEARNGPLPAAGMQLLPRGVLPELVNGEVVFTVFDLGQGRPGFAAPGVVWTTVDLFGFSVYSER